MKLRSAETFTKPNVITGTIIVLILVLSPVTFSGEFGYILAAYVMIGVIYGLGLHVITGMAGMLNLGFVGCAALGAYLSGILMQSLVPMFTAQDDSNIFSASLLALLVTFIIVVVCCGILGLILGYPTLKLSGDYYAIVTLAFSEIIILIIKNLTPLTGGTTGLRDLEKVFFVPELSYKLFQIHNHYVIIAILLVMVALVLGLQFSRFGRALNALRDNRTAAEAMGVNPVYYLTMASVLAAIIGGIGGMTATFYRFNTVTFQSFWFMESVMVLCYIVIGGLGSFRGAIIGGICIASSTEVMRYAFSEWNAKFGDDLFNIPGDLRYLIFGLLLILIMRFMPNGFFGTLKGRENNFMNQKNITDAAQVESSSQGTDT